MAPLKQEGIASARTSTICKTQRKEKPKRSFDLSFLPSQKVPSTRTKAQIRIEKYFTKRHTLFSQNSHDLSYPRLPLSLQFTALSLLSQPVQGERILCGSSRLPSQSPNPPGREIFSADQFCPKNVQSRAFNIVLEQFRRRSAFALSPRIDVAFPFIAFLAVLPPCVS